MHRVSSPLRDTEDLFEIIDKAGDFLIQISRYADGPALYRQAAARYPHVAVFHQGVGCGAGHEALHNEAIPALRAAMSLEPRNQRFVNDLGWCLYEAGRIQEAYTMLKRAVAMNKRDTLAAENLVKRDRISHQRQFFGEPVAKFVQRGPGFFLGNIPANPHQSTTCICLKPLGGF